MTCWVESYHPSVFVSLEPCESEDEIFSICLVTTQLKCHVTLWVGSPHPKYHPTKAVVHRLCEREI